MSSDLSSPSERPAKPTPNVDFEAIPDLLVNRDRWILWKYEWNGEKWDKVPIHPERGHKHDPTDPEIWVSFGDIQSAYRGDIAADGVGFVFDQSDQIVGVDLDNCRNPTSGNTEEWAEDILSGLDSWSEVSPSGTGYHVFVVATLPDGGNKSGDVEIYDNNRFFTVTGMKASGAPESIAERNDELAEVHADYVADETIRASTESTPSDPVDIVDRDLIDLAKNAKNGDKFSRLWNGNAAGYPSQSEADEALCCLLAFWTGKDKRRMDSLFRESGLMREKWNRDDYREKTLTKATNLVSDAFDPSEPPETSSEPKGLTDKDGVPIDPDTAIADRRVVTPETVKIEAGLGEDESIRDLNDKQKAAVVWRLIKQSERYHVRVDRESGTIYGYDNETGIWNADGKRNLRFACREALAAEHYGANVLRELETQVRADPYVEIDASTLGVEAGYIAVKNGLVNLSRAADGRDDAVRPLEPQDYALTRLPVRYDPDASTDLCESFVSDVVEDEKQKAVQEYIGYCLHRGELPFNRALLLVGSGANGKSTFLSMVRGLLGRENTESKPVHQFDQQNVVADLHGCIANIDADLSEGSLSKRGIAMFKRLLGDDTVSARRLYKEAFSFKPEAKHLYACNKVPDVSKLVTDDDVAFWRRWIIVEFPNYFPPQDRDPTLEKRLTSDENLSGVLNWAIKGYSRLMNQGRFTNIETTADETRRLWQSWGESVDEFVVACLEHDPDADNISTSGVNEIYREWCNREGKHAEPNRGTVTKKIKNSSDDFGYKKRARTVDKKNPINGYTSLGFTDEAPSLEEALSDESDSETEDRDDTQATGIGDFD